jgi:hypothetical protein
VTQSTAYGALVSAPNETRTPNIDLRSLRDEAGLSEQDLADELNGLAGRKYGKYPNITKKYRPAQFHLRATRSPGYGRSSNCHRGLRL